MNKTPKVGYLLFNPIPNMCLSIIFLFNTDVFLQDIVLIKNDIT